MLLEEIGLEESMLLEEIVSKICARLGPGLDLPFSTVPGTQEPKSELSLLSPVALCVKQFLIGCVSSSVDGKFGDK